MQHFSQIVPRVCTLVLFITTGVNATYTSVMIADQVTFDISSFFSDMWIVVPGLTIISRSSENLVFLY